MAKFDDFDLDLRVSEKNSGNDMTKADPSFLCVTGLICFSMELTIDKCPTGTKPGCPPHTISNTQGGCPSGTGR